MVIIQHPQEPNENTPTCRGETVQFGGRSDRGSGYLARSERSGPGVILLHEWFGLQDGFKAIADRLCAEGFTVLAPDFFDGKLAANEQEAEVLAKAGDSDLTGFRLKAAARFLIENWHPRLGVIGFSWGAWWAAWLAQQMAVEATVLYYSVADIEPKNFNGALQGHFAEKDHFDPIEEVNVFLKGLADGGMEVDAHVYDAGHWFANPSVPKAFDADAAELALARTIDFLHHHLS